MDLQTFLERVRRPLGHPLFYWLGAGGRAADFEAGPAQLVDLRAAMAQLEEDEPERHRRIVAKAVAAGVTEFPAGRVPACDCSNFSNWALGMAHRTPGWMITDAMHADAQGPQRLYQRLERAEVGALLVYPSPRRDVPGHVGVVVDFDPAGRPEVVHCSAGNFFSFRRAIEKTGSDDFDAQPATIPVWCRRVER